MKNYRIILIDTDIEYDCLEEQTLLAGMEKLGKKGIPVGCRGGGCGVCKVRILDGAYKSKKMSRVHVSVEEEKDGYVLACRCNPVEDMTVEVIGQMKNSFLSN